MRLSTATKLSLAIVIVAGALALSCLDGSDDEAPVAPTSPTGTASPALASEPSPTAPSEEPATAGPIAPPSAACAGVDLPKAALDARIRLSRELAGAGDILGVEGSGFNPHGSVDVYVRGAGAFELNPSTPADSARVTSDGKFNAEVQLPLEPDARCIVIAAETRTLERTAVYTVVPYDSTRGLAQCEAHVQEIGYRTQSESTIRLTPEQGPSGSNLVITGSGFQPDQELTVIVGPPATDIFWSLGETRSDSSGNVVAQVKWADSSNHGPNCFQVRLGDAAAPFYLWASRP